MRRSLSLSLFLKTNGSKEGTNEEVSTKGLGGKLTLRVRERERERGRGGGKQEEEEEEKGWAGKREGKREKRARRNKKSGSPLQEGLGAGGLEQVITSGCGAARAGPS